MFGFRSTALAAAAIVLGLTQMASAADLPVKAMPAVAPSWSWTGFYVGGNVGYGWQADSDTINYYFANFPGITNTGSGFNDKGAFGGLQLGYNYQVGKFVWGVETDFQGSDIKSSFNQNPAPGAACCGNPADIFAGNSKLTWFGTVRGRAGVAVDRFLLYVTGGAAYGRVEQSINATNPALVPPFLFFNSSYANNRLGWVVGAGGEYKITQAWSAKAEYQYLDLGSSGLSGVNAFNGPDFTSPVGHRFHTFRVGINYLFGPRPVIAKY